MEWFFQVLARYLLVYIIKLNVSSRAMLRPVINLKAHQKCSALQVDRGVMIPQRQFAEVQKTYTKATTKLVTEQLTNTLLSRCF